MPDYYYNAIGARPLRVLHKSGLYLCEVQVEDEHGHKLEPAKIVVTLDDKTAKVVRYAENYFGENEDIAEDEFDAIQRFCDAGPSYHIGNEEDLHELLYELLPQGWY